MGCSGADSSDLFLHDLSHEPGAVVGAYVDRHAPRNEWIGQRMDDIGGFGLALHPDRRVCSSSIFDLGKARPLSVRWRPTSYEPTWSHSSGHRGTQGPTVSQSRPLIGSFIGTFGASDRLRPLMCLSLTSQAVSLNRAAMRR